MQRTTKLRITTTRKRTMNLSTSVNRAFCRECQREVQILTSQQAAELLETSRPELEELFVVGKLHAVRTVSGSLWICKDGLISAVNTTGEFR